MEFLGWCLALALLVLLVIREILWRRQMARVIRGVRAIQTDMTQALATPWEPGRPVLDPPPPGQVSALSGQVSGTTPSTRRTIVRTNPNLSADKATVVPIGGGTTKPL